MVSCGLRIKNIVAHFNILFQNCIEVIEFFKI